MAKYLGLPSEIKLLIAQNLSDGQLYNVRSLNSSFFKYWMDTTWRDVGFNMYPSSFKSVLSDLQRVVDPFVAGRLRSLFIEFPSFAISEPEKKISDTIVSTFLDSLTLLPNVTSLKIEFSEKYPVDTSSFLQKITSLPIARKLTDLKLVGPLEKFSWLWTYSAHNTPFPNLTGLCLRVVQSSEFNEQTEPSLLLVDFLRTLIPTLQRLSLETRLDISAIFKVLFQSLSQSDPIFPKLNFLFFRIHFNVSCRSSPQSFRRFLLTHTNLHLLHLDLMTTHIEIYPGDNKPLDAFLAELVNDDSYQLPFLQTLDTYFSESVTQSGFPSILKLIRRTASTLINLKVCHFGYMTDEEALQVLDAVTQGKTQTQAAKPRELKGLMMAITNISLPFIDLLATNFPQLEDLKIWSLEIVDKDSLFTLLRRRWYDPKATDAQDSDVLHKWKLRNLEISCHDWDPLVSSDLQIVVSGAVPALVRKMDEEYYMRPTHWRERLK